MAAPMGGPFVDMGIPPIPPAAFASISMDGDEYVRCNKCGYGGCDVRVSGCGCTLHARCCQLAVHGPVEVCPQCAKTTQGLVLFPMSFREIDDAHRTAMALPASKNRGRKRKSAPDAMDEKGTYVSERRTGRWTNEEMTYCDKLIAKFGTGELPVAANVKLNEFLGNMLKSKQSRLTKKMKNAKLSSKSFQRTSGCLTMEESREFSELEESFFQAITDNQERAEIKFHMQKEWREQFSRVCATVGQPLDADAWLSSVEEMDRRASQAKDAARMARRKMMMGVALRTDSQNPESGIFIEKTESETRAVRSGSEQDIDQELFDILSTDKNPPPVGDLNGKSSLLHSAPFLSKAMGYLQRHSIPFEHVDLWVPSFVPSTSGEQDASCRLCYAGSATVDRIVGEDITKQREITTEMRFNFCAFGDYSQKFSFDVGCGLPGRVYESGRPTWEQSVHNAPHNHFERCGGALQWGIKTVVGIPIASPNVGRIVVTLYSCYDRPKDEEMVARLSEEFTRLMPSPKWKLVVDIGDLEETTTVPIASVAVNSGTGTATADTAPSSADATDHSQPTGNLKDPGPSATGVASAFAPGPSAPGIAANAATTAFAPVAAGTGTAVADLPQSNIPDSAVAVAAAAVAAASAVPEAASVPPAASAAPAAASAAATAAASSTSKDPRIDAVVSLLGEFMPSSPQSPLAPYVPGFMSLRLLLLRPARTPEEDELVRTMLDSYSSYAVGGRQRQDIALMLARDFMFVSQQQLAAQQQQQQQQPFLSLDNNAAAAAAAASQLSSSTSNAGLSLFGLPSTSSSLQNSPALAPIPAPGNNDAMSIVSNS